MPHPKGVPAGAEKSVIGNGTLAVFTSGGNKPGEGFAIFVANQLKAGSPQLDVTLDFSKSSNLVVAGSSTMTATVVVGGCECAKVCTLAPPPFASYRGFQLQWTASWQGAMANPAETAAVLRNRLAIVTKRAKLQQTLEAKLSSFDSEDHRKLLRSAPDVITSEGYVKTKGTKFVDTMFPPVGRSVGMPNAKAQTCWRRPDEFMPPDEKIAVFVGDILASDISQGELGNCWFMCSLAALTEFPGLVQRLFVDDFRRGDGTRADAYKPAADEECGIYSVRCPSLLTSLGTLAACCASTRGRGQQPWLQVTALA